MRNALLDLLKLLGALFITCAHMPTGDPVARVLANIFPLAMMPFFLTSGYYFLSSRKTLNEAHTKKRIVRLTWMTLRWFVFYLIASTVLVYLGKGRLSSVPGMRSWLHMLANPEVWLGVAVFQYIPGIGYQLWFMLALILCNLLAWAVFRFGLKKVAYALILPICILHIGLQEANNQLALGIHTMKISNAWTTGFPLFMLGIWLRENEEAVLKRLSTRALAAMAVIGLITPMIAWMLYRGGRYYVGNYVSGIALFLLALRYGPRVQSNAFTRWAGEASTTVYLVHTVFIESLRALSELCPVTAPALDWIGGPVAFALSLAMHPLLTRGAKLLHRAKKVT